MKHFASHIAKLMIAFTIMAAFSMPQEAFAAPASGKKIFTYSIHYDPPTIDPQKNFAQRAELIALNLHEGLVTTDETMTPVPGVAERWEISKDGLVYTFYLRKNAKWQDGKNVVADDFYYAWQRAIQPKTDSKHVNLVFFIKNAEDIFKGKKQPSELGVKVINDNTIQVTLSSPIPYMLQTFAHGVFFPMRKDVVEANPDSWAQKPSTSMGNGPFYLKEYSMNQRIILAKNEYYWNKNRVKVDEIHFVTIPDNSTTLAAFNAGEIDGFDNIPASEIPRLMMETDEIKVEPQVRTLYYAYNVKAEPFTDRRVRQALSLAINKKELAENVMKVGRKGATGYVPTGLYAEGEDFRKAGGDLGITVTGDVPKARKLLAEAGYPEGKGWPADVKITMSSGYRSAMEAIQEMWKKNLGISVKIETVESKVLADRRTTGKFQISVGGWSAQIFHPIYFLEQITSDGGSNYPQYNNPEYDKLIEQSKMEPDPKKVLEILHKAEQLGFGTDFALVPLYYETNYVMIKNGVTGWYTDPIGRVHIKYVDVSGKK